MCNHTIENTVKVDDLISAVTLARKLRKSATSELDVHELPYGEFEILYTLKNSNTLQPSEIATNLVHEPASVSRLLKSLLHKGLVDYTYDIADRRKVYVNITTLGEKKFGSIAKAL